MIKEFALYNDIYELLNKYIIVLENNQIRCYGVVSNIEVELSVGDPTLELYLSDGLSDSTITIIIPAYCLGNTVKIYYNEKKLLSYGTHADCVYVDEFTNDNLKGENKMMEDNKMETVKEVFYKILESAYISAFRNEYDMADLWKFYTELLHFLRVKISEDADMAIKNHSFDGRKTTIEWSDGTTTTCYSKRDNADPYTGFYIACAKKFMGNGNKVNNLAEKWIEKIPKQRAKAKAKADEIAEREKRIEANKKKRREKNRIRLEAIKIKQEYEAKKLANKKYGVPMDFKVEHKEG